MPDVTDPGRCPTCGGPGEMQHQRHLTQAEYELTPEGLRPIDGWATRTVKTCGDHEVPGFCVHAQAEPEPCAICHAAPGQECAKPDGSPRPVPHPGRDLVPPSQTCSHAHRADCGGHGACVCSEDDAPPARAPRIIGAPTDAERLASAGFPPGVLDAVALLGRHGIDPALVRGQFRAGLTQTGEPAILFDYVTAPDDGHGHEVVELRVIPIDVPPQG
jgi:hypothetical protein